jgi:hypothetical protein
LGLHFFLKLLRLEFDYDLIVEEMDLALGVAGEERNVCDHADERAISIH